MEIIYLTYDLDDRFKWRRPELIWYRNFVKHYYEALQEEEEQHRQQQQGLLRGLVFAKTISEIRAWCNNKISHTKYTWKTLIAYFCTSTGSCWKGGWSLPVAHSTRHLRQQNFCQGIWIPHLSTLLRSKGAKDKLYSFHNICYSMIHTFICNGLGFAQVVQQSKNGQKQSRYRINQNTQS